MKKLIELISRKGPIFAFLGVLVLAAGFVALSLSLSMGVTSVSASSARKGELHATKACPDYQGKAGDHCTITSSNLAEISGATIYYDQAAGIPTAGTTPMLDSNVVLYAGAGNWAVGRCTLDLTTYRGLCTFSDGTGQLAGFKARLDVSPYGSGFSWDGTYSFNREGDRDDREGDR